MSTNIKAAFCKMGVYPFDPSMITENMLAPSRETSLHHKPLLTFETPVWVLVDALTKLE